MSGRLLGAVADARRQGLLTAAQQRELRGELENAS